MRVKLQPGDVVYYYRADPEGKIVVKEAEMVHRNYRDFLKIDGSVVISDHGFYMLDEMEHGRLLMSKRDDELAKDILIKYHYKKRREWLNKVENEEKIIKGLEENG